MSCLDLSSLVFKLEAVRALELTLVLYVTEISLMIMCKSVQNLILGAVVIIKSSIFKYSAAID